MMAKKSQDSLRKAPDMLYKYYNIRDNKNYCILDDTWVFQDRRQTKKTS